MSVCEKGSLFANKGDFDNVGRLWGSENATSLLVAESVLKPKWTPPSCRGKYHVGLAASAVALSFHAALFNHFA
jgi:hypothetical protein